MKTTGELAHRAEALAVPPHGGSMLLTPEEAETYEICELGYPVLRKRDAEITNEMVNRMREELGI